MAGRKYSIENTCSRSECMSGNTSTNFVLAVLIYFLQMTVKITLVKVFTQNPEEGNPAGVVADASNLTTEQMQSISLELGFSESVFIIPATDTNIELRFFSPTQEVGICAHATLAASRVLIDSRSLDGKSGIFQYDTQSGEVSVDYDENGLLFMKQKAPEFLFVEKDVLRIADLLSIDPVHILTTTPIQLVSTGTPKLLIPIDSIAALQSIIPKQDEIKAYCETTGSRGFYPFTTESQYQSDFSARQFNPLAGIPEDPITGIAAGALGAYVKKYGLSQKEEITIEQGYLMRKGGKLFVKANDGIRVGGFAVIYGQKTVWF
jgi:trans-2,3-dihydro-3-hydroxyanthranilate isomerase